MANGGDGGNGGVGGPEAAASPMTEVFKRVGAAAQWSGIAAVIVFSQVAGGFFEVFTAILAGVYALLSSYGLAIILLTIIVRLVLLPLSIKQVQSQREMQKIQPEIAKIRKKYKDDRQKQSEEQMKLFKEHGVNPAAGCLPLVLQFPVFIALFQVLRTPTQFLGVVRESALAHELQRVPEEVNAFLGFHLDCSASNVTGLTLPLDPSGGLPGPPWCNSGILASIPYVLIVVLTALTTYITQRQMQATQPDSPQAQQMQAMMKIFPIMFILFGWGFPAGLGIYWLTTNILSAGQQYLMLNYWAPPLTTGQPKSAAASGSGKGTGAKATGRDASQPSRSKGPKTSSGRTGGNPASGRKGSSDGGRPTPRSSSGGSGKKKRRK